MASYTISPIWGAGAQLFDNSGNVLTGGKIYTYLAGTTTPATTYTTPIGAVANSNPIIANSAGRLTNEIWFPVSGSYKFVLKDANDALIATYDNIPTTPQPPIVNDASSISYEPGYIVNAGNFTIGETYRIDTVGTTDFVAIGAAANVTGIHFTATGVGSGTGTAEYSRTVQAKLRETVSVKDFGAVGDGVADDTAAIQTALTSAAANDADCYLPSGTYVITNITLDGVRLFGSGKLFWSSASPADQMMITLKDNSKLDGISIDANLAGNYPAKFDPRTESVIYINGDNCQVTNIFMTGAPTCCIWGGLATKYALIENNTFRNTPFSGDGILCRGSYWRIANNLFLGVLGYTMRVGLFGGDGVGECANNVLTGNVVYGSNAGPLHVELYATGTVFDSNVSRYTASAVKIQYQPGEPVYNTIVTNNVFMDSLYPGTWNDTTGTWTPNTSGGQWGVSGIGGFGTIISNNTWINVTGISLYNRSSVFTGNRILGAGDNNVSILRVQPENTGCVISGNTIEAASGYNPTFLWLGAEDIKVTDNRFVSNSDITALVRVNANNCQIKDNVFEEGSGAFIVASTIKNTTITGNTFKNTTTPLAQVSTISVGTIIQDNIGLDSVPNLVPVLTISAGSTTLDIPRQGKYRVGTSANGVSENLATITGGQPGQIILLTRNNSLQNVTLVTGGNIQLAGGASYLLTAEHIGLIWNGGAWNELFRD